MRIAHAPVDLSRFDGHQTIYRFIGEFPKSAEVCVLLTEQIAAIALKVATDVHVLRQATTVYTGDAKKMVSERRSGELSSLYLG